MITKDKQVPEMYLKQNEAFEFSKGKDFFALFMEQGTGKSKVAIEKAFFLWEIGEISGCIIISPNAIKEQWIDEQFKEHFPSYNFVSFLWEGKGTIKARQEFSYKLNKNNSFFVFSANVESFQSTKISPYIQKMLLTRKLFIIMDESTRIKNGRRKPNRGKRGGARRTNLILDLFFKSIYKCILTGTPTPHSPFDLWSQFEFLCFDFFGMDYFYFQHRYGILIKRSFQNRAITTIIDEQIFTSVKTALRKAKEKNNGKLDHKILEILSFRYNINIKDVMLINNLETYTPYKNLKELKKKISSCTFFAKKKECIDLPDKVYEKLYCPLSAEQKRIYKDIKTKMYADFEGRELTLLNKVTMTMRLQMITGGIFPYLNVDMRLDKFGEEQIFSEYKYEPIKECGKLSVLLDDLEEVDKETSIIIWAVFRGEIQRIEAALKEKGYTCDKYYGDSSNEVIKRFKAGDFRILVCSPLKGGEGLNLQISTLHYYYSNPFQADKRLQSEDRSHRIGQTNKVTYKDLICKDTVDERLYEILKRKEDLINYFREGGTID